MGQQLCHVVELVIDPSCFQHRQRASFAAINLTSVRKTGYKRAGNESVESYKDVKTVQKAPSNLKPVSPNKTYETNFSIESFSPTLCGKPRLLLRASYTHFGRYPGGKSERVN